MPESSIGLFPDAGASLPRLRKTSLGITGFIIGAADCFALGLSTATVRDRAIEEPKARANRLRAPSEIFEVIRKYQIDAEESLMKVQSQKQMKFLDLNNRRNAGQSKTMSAAESRR